MYVLYVIIIKATSYWLPKTKSSKNMTKYMPTGHQVFYHQYMTYLKVILSKHIPIKTNIVLEYPKIVDL